MAADDPRFEQHLDALEAYMKSHRAGGFSRTRYAALITAVPAVYERLMAQKPAQVIAACERTVSFFSKRFGFTRNDLAAVMEGGFMPSLCPPGFAQVAKNISATAQALRRYPFTSISYVQPLSYVKLALTTRSLRDTPASVLLRKLDEAMAFHQAHGHPASGAVLSRMRAPAMFHVGRAEIEEHITGMAALYADCGFERSRYLKAVLGQPPYPRVLGVRPQEAAASLAYLQEALGPHGFTKKAWFNALLQHPPLILRAPEELEERLTALERQLVKIGAGGKSALVLHAHNPKLFARDPSAVTDRARLLAATFAADGLTVPDVVKGMETFPALVRFKGENLVANLAQTADYLEEQGVARKEYIRAVAANLSLAMVPFERQRDNHRLMAASYQEGLIVPAAPGSLSPAQQALRYTAMLVHTTEDLALRRLWARLCTPETGRTTQFLKATKGTIETGLRGRFGAQADLRQLAADELNRTAAKLSVTFGTLAYGAATGKRNSAVNMRRVQQEAAPAA